MAETMEAFLARRHIAALATHNGDGSIQTAAVRYLYEGGSDEATVVVTPARWNWLDQGEAFGGVLETPGYMLPLG